MKKKHSQEFLRKRKMLLILPLIVIPLLSMTFYGLGGGKGRTKEIASQEGNKGYNTNLPGAKFDKRDNSLDKVEAYKKADQDSARLKDQLREDPYHIGSMPTTSTLPPITTIKGIRPDKDSGLPGLKTIPAQDTTADVVLKRLEYLKQSLRQPSGQTTAPSVGSYLPPVTSNTSASDLPRLEQMMQQLKSKQRESEQDPQLDKLNGMLEKIMQLQHPSNTELSTDTTKKPASIESYPVKNSDKGDAINLPIPAQGISDSRVFLSTEDVGTDSITDNVINAIVDGDQTLVSGGTLDMRLTEDAEIKGVSIPRNSTVHGKVSLSGERMVVIINSIKAPSGIFPVTLQVYDYDGLAGIKIPGAITRDVAKESADQAISGIGLTTMDPSLKAQAASVGIQAAKALASRKVKLIKATIPNGHLIYLMNIKN